MKYRLNFYKLLAFFAALAVLTSAFPVFTESAFSSSVFQSAAVETQQAIDVIAAPSEEMVAPASICLSSSADSSFRIDYLLNTNCGEVVLGSLPTWPKLSVVKTVVSQHIVATTLPAAPTIRFVQINPFKVSTSDAIIALTLTLMLWAFVRLGKTVTKQLSSGLIRQPKTLFELQVQRC